MKRGGPRWVEEDRGYATPCWIWQRNFNNYGYGSALDVDGRKRGAHILAYEGAFGLVPKGLEIDHLCRQRACVNPDHLEAVTHRENCRRGNGWSGRHARKTHCPQGHPYDEANTYVAKGGGRHCRACHRENERQRRRRIKQAA